MSPPACSSSLDPSSFNCCNHRTHHSHFLHKNLFENHITSPSLSAHCLGLTILDRSLVKTNLGSDQPQSFELRVFVCNSCRAGDNYGPWGKESGGPPFKSPPMHIQYNECMQRPPFQRHHNPACQKLFCHHKLDSTQLRRFETSTANQNSPFRGRSSIHKPHCPFCGKEVRRKRSFSSDGASGPVSACAYSPCQTCWLLPRAGELESSPYPRGDCGDLEVCRCLPMGEPPTQRFPETAICFHTPHKPTVFPTPGYHQLEVLPPETQRSTSAGFAALPGHASFLDALDLLGHRGGRVLPLWEGCR